MKPNDFASPSLPREDVVEDVVKAPRRLPAGAGFSNAQGSRQKHFPTHLLVGSMTFRTCGGPLAQVSGSGGYYGCLAASKNAFDNKVLVRRALAEKNIVGAVRDRLDDAEEVARSSQKSKRR